MTSINGKPDFWQTVFSAIEESQDGHGRSYDRKKTKKRKDIGWSAMKVGTLQTKVMRGSGRQK